MKLKWYSADSTTDSLVVVPVSKAAAEQRAGRAGRIRSGKVYRLYTEEAWEKLPEHTPDDSLKSQKSLESHEYLEIHICLLEIHESLKNRKSSIIHMNHGIVDFLFDDF